MQMCIAVGDYGDRRPVSSSDIDAVKNLINQLFVSHAFVLSY